MQKIVVWLCAVVLLTVGCNKKSDQSSGSANSDSAVPSTDKTQEEEVAMDEAFQDETYDIAAGVTDIDGNTYKTVRIGNQVWMAENLRTTHYADGTEIPMGSKYECSKTDPYRYVHETIQNNEKNLNNVSQYGYLYNWPAVVNGASNSNSFDLVQGICPDGWHVPSMDEWRHLILYLEQNGYGCGNGYNAHAAFAKALAANNDWESDDTPCAVGNEPETNNATGFSALPAGGYFMETSYYGSYQDFGTYAYFWSSKETITGESAEGYSLHYSSKWIGRERYSKAHGCSVRCVLD